MRYYTLLGEGHSEVVDRKSRFLGAAFPVSSQEKAQEIIHDIRQEHYKARHNTYAMIIGEDGMLTRSSDDGEPSGTAGAPMLQVLDGAGLKNALVVVTRYFGGTLLGTGGLIRAYTQAAKEAVDDAGIGVMTLHSCFKAVISYQVLDKVLYYVKQQGLSEPEAAYGSDVELTFSVEAGMEDSVKNALVQMSSGTVVFDDLPSRYEASRLLG